MRVAQKIVLASCIMHTTFLLILFMPTFSRSERLKSTRVLNQIFKTGQSFSAYPIRLVWLVFEKKDLPPKGTFSIESEFPVQFALSVPKRNFKKAVQRNILRRRLREAYRLHKSKLYDFIAKSAQFEGKQLAFMVLYVAKEELPFADIEKGVLKMLRKFEQEGIK